MLSNSFCLTITATMNCIERETRLKKKTNEYNH